MLLIGTLEKITVLNFSGQFRRNFKFEEVLAKIFSENNPDQGRRRLYACDTRVFAN